MPTFVHQVKPTYPQLARTVRVQGAVILEAIIDREGRVENLKVLSGHPLLVPAACRGCPTVEISPHVAEWTTRGSVDAGDGELQSWSAVMVGWIDNPQGLRPLPPLLRGELFEPGRLDSGPGFHRGRRSFARMTIEVLPLVSTSDDSRNLHAESN